MSEIVAFWRDGWWC